MVSAPAEQYREPSAAGTICNELQELATDTGPLPHLEESRDSADNFLLSMAQVGKADFLVTPPPTCLWWSRFASPGPSARYGSAPTVPVMAGNLAKSQMSMREHRAAGARLARVEFRPAPPGGQGGTRAAGGDAMSKGNDRKKETKKKPAKSLLEKRAAKAEKRGQKRQWAIA